MYNLIIVLMLVGILAVGRIVFTTAKRRKSLGGGDTTIVSPPIDPSSIAPTSSDRWKQQYFLRLKQTLDRQHSEQAHLSQELTIQQLLAALTDKSNQVIGEQLKATEMRLENNAASNELEKKKAIHEIEESKTKLEWAKIDLASDQVERQHQLNQVDMGKREIQVQLVQMRTKHQEQLLRMHETAHAVEVLLKELAFAEKALDMKAQKALLQIKDEKLNQYAAYLKQDYDLSLSSLTLQARENNVSFREKKLALQSLYTQTTNAIDKLQYRTRNEKSRDRLEREDEYFRQFLSAHFSWLELR